MGNKNVCWCRGSVNKQLALKQFPNPSVWILTRCSVQWAETSLPLHSEPKHIFDCFQCEMTHFPAKNNKVKRSSSQVAVHIWLSPLLKQKKRLLEY